MSTKFEEVDAAVLKAIEAGAHTFNAIFYAVSPIARPLASTDRMGFPNTERLIDQRLQALRKQEKISYKFKKWVLVG